MDQELFTTAEVALTLGCCPGTVRRYIDTGELTASRIGDRYVISAADLDDFIAAQNEEAEEAEEEDQESEAEDASDDDDDDDLEEDD